MDFAALMPAIAERLLGAPNRAHSSRDELRYGTNGSMRVSVGGAHAGTWRDHEAQKGGGVVALVSHLRGCDEAAAIAWIRDEFPDNSAPPPRIVSSYQYTDESGALLYEVVRQEPKAFRQRRPDGRGGWIWNLKGVSPVLYRLPDIQEAVAHGRRVFIVEGEKDADSLWRDGVPATCNSGGAGKWRTGLAADLAGAEVVILPDNDDAGRKHAEAVARSLKGKAASVKIVPLPGLAPKGDVSDWRKAGGTIERLNDLADASPEWREVPARSLRAVWFGREDDEPPLRWLVKGLLPDGGLSAMFGPPGCTKSFLALDLGLHIAHEREFFGRRVRGGAVAYVSGEGSAGMRLRMKAWRAEKSGDPAAPFVLIPQALNLFDDDEDAARLVSDIAAWTEERGQPFGLIVFDTLSRMLGAGDEDKARDVAIVVGRAAKIQEATGAHVLFLHHTGKDRERGMRGSSALLGAVDAAIEVTQFASGLCEARTTKLKDGEPGGPLAYELATAVLGQDEHGDDISSAVLSPVDAAAGSEAASLTGSERIALKALKAAARGAVNVPPDVPTNTQAALLDAWRDQAYRDGISRSRNPEAQRKAFARAKDGLRINGLVGITETWAWVIE